MGEDLRSIGVVGLGKMGRPMAGHLVAAGYQVVGYDPWAASADAAAALGVKVVSSPAAVAAHCDATLVVVGVDAEVEAVCVGPDGIAAGAEADHLVLICSTVRPGTVHRLDTDLRSRGLRVADATLCRAEHAAVDATLLLLLGGDAEELAPIRPALSAFASDVVHVGGVGAGQVAKMINNLLLWVSVVANQESLRLGGRLGMDQDRLVEALLLSSGANWALETWGKSRPMPWAEDDMQICLELAAEVGFPMPLAEVVRTEITDVKQRKAAEVPGGAAASMYAFVEEIA